MDAGQITQGLRADAFQQGGQGANFMQLMESGVSFADIMRMISGNNQNMPGIMPYMSDVSMNSQVPLIENAENEQSLFENMQELIGLSAFQNMANASDMQELKNILSSVDLDNVKDNGDNQDFNIENAFVTKSDLSEVGNIYQLANNPNKEDIEKFIDILKNIENSDLIPAFKEQTGSKELNVVQNPDNVQEVDKTPILSEVQKMDNVQNSDQDLTDTVDVKNPNEFQSLENTQKVEHKKVGNLINNQDSKEFQNIENFLNTKDSQFSEGIQDTKELQILEEIQENKESQISEIVQDTNEFQAVENAPILKESQDSESVKEVAHNPVDSTNINGSQKHQDVQLFGDMLNLQNNYDILNEQKIPNDNLSNKADVLEVSNEKPISKTQNNPNQSKKTLNNHNGNIKNLEKSFDSTNVQTESKILSDTQLIQKLESFLDSENLDTSKTLNIKNNIDDSVKQNENVFNVNNLMNSQALHIISEKLGIVKNDNSSVPNKVMMPVTNVQNENLNNNLSDKLADIFNVVSPKIMKAAINETGTVNNENKFVIDLLSELSNEKDRRDVFDFSESVVKVDPLQMAGLLDFISTGTGIPQAMDISDNTMFKNIDNANVAEKVSGKMIFDPKEMIESGEMEIVSYIPAEKKAQNNTQQNNNFTENGEKTIDFARTMKSVKENVKPVIDDEIEKSDETNSALTAEDMNNVAQRVDISFDRAYAELEMNKVKYGSADQQLFKGIAENLKKGRSEFTVKLRPEGLGEILVKLVSDDGGKTVLSMIASSEKTAQLLNRDLASLQSSLNDHNVEIENNSVKTVENVNSSQTSFSQYDERRQDEGNQQNQFRQLRGKLGNISVGSASFDNETESIKGNSVDSVLNITI